MWDSVSKFGEWTSASTTTLLQLASDEPVHICNAIFDEVVEMEYEFSHLSARFCGLAYIEEKSF